MQLKRKITKRDKNAWHASDGLAGMTSFTRKVFKRIQLEARTRDKLAWQIQSIATVDEPDEGCSVCIFVVTLPNGLTVEIEYDSAHAQEVFYDLEITDVEWAANFFAFGYDDLECCNFDKIAVAVHQTVMLLRTTFQEWADQHGIGVHLIGSKVRWSIWDRYTNVVPHVVSISALDEDLQPSVLEFELDCVGDNSENLQELFDQLSCREAKLKALKSQGADGKIDLLAMRSLAEEGPLEDNLRNWACTRLQRDCRDLHYSKDFCHIRLHRRIPSEPNIELDGSRVRLCGMHLPDSMLANCMGSPITDIIDFEHFSPEMTILKARNRSCSEGNFVEFEIDQPHYFFCSLSGRCWL